MPASAGCRPACAVYVRAPRVQVRACHGSDWPEACAVYLVRARCSLEYKFVPAMAWQRLIETTPLDPRAGAAAVRCPLTTADGGPGPWPSLFHETFARLYFFPARARGEKAACCLLPAAVLVATIPWPLRGGLRRSAFPAGHETEEDGIMEMRCRCDNGRCSIV
ncbi:hypothetical protein GUJ93_ZPchr0007g5969 [Zizania palustris]|uniref:Uncharacterized protein n=1 Tax=Zizania palustris TaxID=103762 RepID=A0A8J5TBR5_ZIZPA|nr:hypothetical protein GUJ93_ZPchr0007g5969 [Zizania palustris]